MRYVATIDCGSSNVRCVVFDVDTGLQVSVASQDWYVPKNSDIPGAYDFDSKVNWPLVCKCTREALSRVNSKDVVAVTASGFRHGIFCTDESGTDIIYGCFNMDSRSDNSYIHEHGLEEKIHITAGDWPSLHGLPRLMWIKKNDPAAFERIDKFMLVSDWVVYRLCGEVAVEPGNASSTLMLDLRTRQWSTEIIDLCGLPEHIFPRIVDAGTVLGRIDAIVAEETGLSEGTLVTVGVADTQAGLLGVGASGIGTSAIVGGTYWLDCHTADKPYTDPEFRTRTSCHSERGQWIFEGVGFYVGLSVRWFRDAFGAHEKEIAERYGIDPYYLLDRLTLDVPAGSYGLQVLLSDVANQRDWKMCAPTFMGWDILDPTKSHKGVFFKAILENACYQSYGEYESIRRVTADSTVPRELLLSGGSAHSPVWCQILSDVMGKPVSTPLEKEGTSLGAAIYAAVGAGIYGDSSEAVSAVVKQGDSYEPNMANHEVYMDEYARWRELYANGLELVGCGLVKSMWQPRSTMTATQLDNPWRLR
jgi:autoinducer 2 (AI-2) kinase